MDRAELLVNALRKGTLKPAQIGPNDAALLKTYITSQRQPAAVVRPQPVPTQPAPQPVAQSVVKPTPVAKTGMGYVREAELKPPTEEELTRFARPYTPPIEKLTPEQRVALPAQSKILPSLTAGVGDVISTAGGAAKWLGAKKTGERLVAKGEEMRKAHEIPTEEFSWKQLLDPNFYTTNVMRSVPFSAALIPAAVAGAYGLGTAGAAMGLGAFGKVVLGAVGGGLLNRAVEGAMEAGGTYNEAIARGMTPEQADKAAQQTFKKNLALAGMDIGEFATAFVPIPGAKTLGKAGKIALGAGRLAATAGQEAVEEGVQEVIQRRSLGETAPVSELLKQPQTQEAMTIGAIHGGGLGAAGTAFTEIKSRVIAKLPPDVQGMVNTAVKQMEAAGVPKDRAEVQALDAVAETPQGQKAIQDAVNEVKETAEAKPEAAKPTAPVAKVKPEVPKPIPQEDLWKVPQSEAMEIMDPTWMFSDDPRVGAGLRAAHRQAVEKAFKEGKPVPEFNLKQYAIRTEAKETVQPTAGAKVELTPTEQKVLDLSKRAGKSLDDLEKGIQERYDKMI
ncbi:MAG: hypothetical protein M0R06_24355, partial [Sphaerochaeta sp.]|nr:hypothetical protein [Sphaerochaeta sp.]